MIKFSSITGNSMGCFILCVLHVACSRCDVKSGKHLSVTQEHVAKIHQTDHIEPSAWKICLFGIWRWLVRIYPWENCHSFVIKEMKMWHKIREAFVWEVYHWKCDTAAAVHIYCKPICVFCCSSESWSEVYVAQRDPISEKVSLIVEENN